MTKNWKSCNKRRQAKTFITDDSNRDELVRHVYDITYGSIKKSDNLVIIDDSIVRGTTLQKVLLKCLTGFAQKNNNCFKCTTNQVSRLLWDNMAK